MTDELGPPGAASANVSAGNSADLYGAKAISALTPKPDNDMRNPNKTGPKFVPDKFNYRRVGTAPAQDHEKPGSWQPMYPIAQKPIKI